MEKTTAAELKPPNLARPRHMIYANFSIISKVLGVLAAPLQDFSTTTIDLEEQPGIRKNDDHLFVTVTRVDDLVDDDGSLLAERIMAVRVSFDIIDHQLRCNGVPVEIGVSNIQVEAQIAANPEKLTITSEEDAALLADNFDVGLATVQVTAAIMDEFTTEDGIFFRRINVQERIIEINNEKVVQTDLGQQILDVSEDGQVHRYTVDPMTGFTLPGLAMPDDTVWEDTKPVLAPNDKKNCAGAFLVDPVIEWWNAQTSTVRGLITGAICAVFFAIALAVRQLILSANAAYEVLNQQEAEEAEEAVWNEKKSEYKDETERPMLA
ncbi:uncharacterized protein BYT42DRAFT_544554 [Radiomyces spectabilis]|uniref:uncharacterized protein n=1 Tax=Radiomyces spectabilis TaxID=64574 RepID=UPI00221EF976|nr:uncharacterized protein BYT42DRAFT_544554 [Radiomyces spectabilis]KAI8384691.1 hypothetical protein BYT42DRAFT_544554 [Radiomyces spectabilis]